MTTPVRRAWLVSAVWIALIALESFFGSSENTGTILRPILEFLFGPLQRNTFYLAHASLRKGGHFFGYAILSLTLYRAWWTTLVAHRHPDRLSWRNLARAWSWRAAVLALLGTLAVAGLDEWHQSFALDRSGSLRDVVLDEWGGWLAQLVLLIFTRPLACSVPVPRKNAARETIISA